MVIETSRLASPVEKVVDLGIIDSWFRGVAGLVPQGADAEFDIRQEMELHTNVTSALPDLNTHTLNYGSYETITENEIKSMAGFRQLLQSAAKNDVRVDIALCSHGRLEIAFEPDEPFLRSHAFGAGCISAMPALFAEWVDKAKK